MQIVFDNSIQSFTLIIHLKMISSRKTLFNHLDFTYFSSKIRDNARIFICDNVSQKVKIIFNMLKKELNKIYSYKIILNKYKQHVLDNIIYYNKNVVKFLTVLN